MLKKIENFSYTTSPLPRKSTAACFPLPSSTAVSAKAALQSFQSHHQWVQWREIQPQQRCRRKIIHHPCFLLQEFAAKLAAL
jgi:hypothetical protein